MRRAARLTASLALAVAFVAGPAVASADGRPSEVEFTLDSAPEADGTPVSIDLTLVTADPGTALPAIVLAHGFGGTKADSLGTARDLARRGYAVIAYTARGFGRSGGLIHLNDPDYEGADVRRLVDFAATRPEISRSGDDPLIGFAGVSYGGAAAALAGALDDRVDAIAPAFTWHSLTQALFPQYRAEGAAQSLADVPATEAGVFKQRWAGLLLSSASGSHPDETDPDETDPDETDPDQTGPDETGPDRPRSQLPDPLCGRLSAALCTGYQQVAEGARPGPALLAALSRSDLGPLLGRVSAPTLLIQGENDTLFPPDQADANLRALPVDTPARLMWVVGGHDGDASPAEVVDDLAAWFDRYLRGDARAAAPGFSVVVPQTSLVGGRGTREPEVREATYPGRGADVAVRRVRLAGAEQRVVAPAGGVPAALTQLPGVPLPLDQVASAAGYALAVLPGQTATFTSAPLSEPLDLVGSSRLDLVVQADTDTATLFLSVWDLGPDVDREQNGRTVRVPSTAVLPQRAVAPLRLDGLLLRENTAVTVALPAVAHRVPVNHRLRVVIASTDQAYATPSRPATYRIALAGDGTLSVPQLVDGSTSADAIRLPVALLASVAALAVLAVATALLARRRRRLPAPRPDLATRPLVVEGLSKSYPGGVRAVDGVSFDVRPGQVLGLLGPNGAGKTTAMRMVVGLIRPDAGAVYVYGEPVSAGAGALGLVGTFIEGPGFLPHLTGLRNLTAYWEATGRPLAEAHLDQALDIAGLGEPLHRPVRTYSQGMRQRLGLAQAMLGLPPLLLLDEPTNGLDPPQIKAMRGVLADYAASGRTVVISSHLLGEVEQTCSHVVVMDRGRVVLTGAVADLTHSAGVTLVRLSAGSDLGAAERALAAEGLAVQRAGTQLRVAGERTRGEVVALLVGEGFAVDSVAGHRQLEDVFLGLVGSARREVPR